MFNKELLMVGATGKEPHILMYVTQYNDPAIGHDYYGYNTYCNAGEVSKIPCWGRYGTMKNYSALEVLGTKADLTLETIINWRNPYTSNKLVVTRLDTEKSVMFFNKDASTYALIAADFLFTAAEIEKEIPLIFDPPPRLLFGSRYGRTDLGIGYYVEEVPWEAQDAEQGTSDDRRRRWGVVDSTLKFLRGLLYRSNPVGLNRSDAYPLGRTSEQRGYCSYSNTAKEYPTTYTKCRNLQGHNRRWVYNRRLLQTRNSNHSASKRGVSRGALPRVTSKEALYA